MTWLAVLLVRHVGVMDYAPWEAAVVIATAAAGYVLGAVILTWIATRRHRPRHGGDDAPIPSVAIIVPVHDDAERLGACLAAIRSQTYADTVVLSSSTRVPTTAARTRPPPGSVTMP